MPTSTRTLRSHRAATAVLVLALAAGTAGCGSSDEDPAPTTTAAAAPTTTSASPAGTTTATTGSSGGDAGLPSDAAEVKAALVKGRSAIKDLRTARTQIDLESGPITTTAKGTFDLVDERYALDQTVQTQGQTRSLEGYGEKGRIYLLVEGTSQWQVTENPVGSGSPLEQVEQVRKSRITSVGGVETIGGVRCRRFEAENKVADGLGNARSPQVRQLLQNAPKGATIPLSGCVDARGLTLQSKQAYSPAKVFGTTAAGTGMVRVSVTITDYGKAPEPKRPDGIDDATPLATPGTAAPTS